MPARLVDPKTPWGSVDPLEAPVSTPERRTARTEDPGREEFPRVENSIKTTGRLFCVALMRSAATAMSPAIASAADDPIGAIARLQSRIEPEAQSPQRGSSSRTACRGSCVERPAPIRPEGDRGRFWSVRLVLTDVEFNCRNTPTIVAQRRTLKSEHPGRDESVNRVFDEDHSSTVLRFPGVHRCQFIGPRSDRPFEAKDCVAPPPPRCAVEGGECVRSFQFSATQLVLSRLQQ